MNDHHEDHPPDRLDVLLRLSGPRSAPPADRVELARARAFSAWQSEVRFARRRQAVWTTIGALAAAAVLVLAITWLRDGPAREPAGNVLATVTAKTGTLLADDAALNRGDRVYRNAVIRTRSGDRAALILLNGGAELRLDVDTTLRLLNAATVALERGAVFVDTGTIRGARRTLEVRTPAGVARDIGTRFEVRVIGEATRVRVRDGVVQLQRGAALHTAERGVELLADAAGVARRDAGITGPEWHWVTLAAPPLDVDGKTLAVFLDWVSREGAWTITFTDDALRRSASKIVIRGSIDGLTPEQALETILPTCGLKHRIENGTVIVSRA